MKQTMNRGRDMHADDPMVHLTTQVLASLGGQTRDPAKLGRSSPRLLVTDAIQRKMHRLEGSSVVALQRYRYFYGNWRIRTLPIRPK